MTSPTPFDTAAGKTLTILGLPVLGGVITHLWNRYRNRLATLRWSAFHQPMAFATHDFGWGKVEILYNGVPTKNLHISTVTFQNASSRDLENVAVKLVASEGSLILKSAGQFPGSAAEFPLGAEYAGIIAVASRRELTPAEIKYWQNRADFVVPVLNRDSTAEFRMLISRTDYSTPTVLLSCDHLGVRIAQEPPTEKAFGVRRGQAQAAGVLTSIVATVVAFRLAPTWATVIVVWLFAAFILVVGAYVVRFLRAFARLAD